MQWLGMGSAFVVGLCVGFISAWSVAFSLVGKVLDRLAERGDPRV